MGPLDPACILTFIVSKGWMVLCEAARAMAPATMSCAGLASTWGAGGGVAACVAEGDAATVAGWNVGAVVVAVAVAAAATTCSSLRRGW